MILEELAVLIFKDVGNKVFGNFGTCLLNCMLRIPVQEEDKPFNLPMLHFLLFLHPIRQQSLM
jgi:hypothetical protein